MTCGLNKVLNFDFKDCFGLTIRIEYFGTSMYRYTIRITVKTGFGYKFGCKLRL